MRPFTKAFIVGLVSFFLLALGIGVMAQDDPNTPLPPPDEHMQDFAWFIGEWDVQSHMLINADTDEWLDESLQTRSHLRNGRSHHLRAFLWTVGRRSL